MCRRAGPPEIEKPVDQKWRAGVKWRGKQSVTFSVGDLRRARCFLVVEVSALRFSLQRERRRRRSALLAGPFPPRLIFRREIKQNSVTCFARAAQIGMRDSSLQLWSRLIEFKEQKTRLKTPLFYLSLFLSRTQRYHTHFSPDFFALRLPLSLYQCLLSLSMIFLEYYVFKICDNRILYNDVLT